jgi:hypothetical protein
MKRYETNHRVTTPIGALGLRSKLVLLLLPMLIALWEPASGQQTDTAPVANHVSLTTEQVVQNLVRMNL